MLINIKQISAHKNQLKSKLPLKHVTCIRPALSAVLSGLSMRSDVLFSYF